MPKIRVFGDPPPSQSKLPSTPCFREVSQIGSAQTKKTLNNILNHYPGTLVGRDGGSPKFRRNYLKIPYKDPFFGLALVSLKP